MSKETKRPRWWLLFLIWGAAGSTAAYCTFYGDNVGDKALLIRAAAIFLGLFASGFWLLFLSRLPWSRRLAGMALAVVCIAAFNLIYEPHFTGDLVPEFRLRHRSVKTQIGQADAAAAQGANYSQFMGQNRLAVQPDLNLIPDWEQHPPSLVWRRPVGAAWSAFAVSNDLAVTQEQHDDQECVIAYRLQTGEEVWRWCYTASYASTLGGDGPRATPTIVDERVYTMGSMGDLMCLALADGRLIWQKQVFEMMGTKPPEWGCSVSPLVLDDVVVASAGDGGQNALLAFNREDGGLAWHAAGDPTHYSSPSLMTLAGVPQIVVFTAHSVRAYQPQDGSQLWTYPWQAEAPVVAVPAQVGFDRLVVSAGYGMGAACIEVNLAEDGRWQVNEQWRNIFLKSKFANMMFIEDSLYGLDEGILTCLATASGERRWKRGRMGHGQLLRAGRYLLVSTEKGEVVLLDPNPQAYRELGRFQAIQGKSWNPPALAGDLLLVRNAEEAACYRLAQKAAPATALGAE